MTIGPRLAEFGWSGRAGPARPHPPITIGGDGRDHDAVEKAAIFPVTVGADGAGAGEQRRWAAAGIRTAIGILSGTDPVRQVEIVGEQVVPAVADV